MIDRFQFSSDGLASDEAFGAYRRLYEMGSDVSRGTGTFHARVHGVRLDSVLLFERELNGVVHARGARVSGDGFDHFALHLVLGGELLGGPESRFERAGVGDLLLVDTARPSRTEARDLHVLTASVAREAVEAAAGHTDRLHGRIVSAPDTVVLRDLMLSVVRNVHDLPAEALPGITRALVELLGATLDSGSSTTAAARSIDFARRHAVIRHVGGNLGDRTLDADAIARATGQSRSALYRLFRRDGGVAQYVMSRRLAAVRDALEKGSTDSLAVLAERFGFADESHMNRRFNRAYGRPAGAFRREVTSGDPTAVTAARRRWVGWMSEIS
jgi:AraC-like DNA-binding protein